ncbi:hypothetical protein [Streptomyces sp. CA-251247]|uniref:hypothetical protein n=1 Tax=Streptomyces sp. CA-251247 TaxID=3240062 RepID=UPI003D94EBF9
MEKIETSDEDLVAAADEALKSFAEGLERLHIESGAPSLRQIEKREGRRTISAAAISEALNGKRLPSLDFVLELVRRLTANDDVAGRRWHEKWIKTKSAQKKAAMARKRVKAASAATAGVLAPAPHLLVPPPSAAAGVDSSDTGERLDEVRREAMRWATSHVAAAAVLVDEAMKQADRIKQVALEEAERTRISAEVRRVRSMELQESARELREEASELREEALELRNRALADERLAKQTLAEARLEAGALVRADQEEALRLLNPTTDQPTEEPIPINSPSFTVPDLSDISWADKLRALHAYRAEIRRGLEGTAWED